MICGSNPACTGGHMLLYLSIQNIAVIESAQVELSDGLNILTGETGAGKSIVIDSVNLALGERADKTLIRTGAEKAQVEAVFDISTATKTQALLKDMLDIEDTELIILREMSANGRNVCRINGRMATLSQLKSLTTSLVDIHGQHQHQSLLHEDTHLPVLDGFCGKSFDTIYRQYLTVYDDLQDIRQQIKQKQINEMERQRQIEMYEFQIKEIDDAALKSGEDDTLRQQREILQNAEKIKNAVDTAHFAFSGSLDTDSIMSLLSQSTESMDAIADISEQYSQLSKRLQQLMIEVDDIADELQILNRSFDFSASDIDTIENRLSLIKRLGRKYGSGVDAILAYREDIGEKLYTLDEHEIIIEELTRKEKKLYSQAMDLATQMSTMRQNAAKKLNRTIQRELGTLGMENAQFDTEFHTIKDSNSIVKLDRHGLDQVRFLISTNSGESLKPLSNVVSGGEMSRIMLVLKTLTAQIDDIETLIFDEIDTGISGETARIVGEKMSSIAANRQVICVTHSAQIAAFADNHVFIRKQSDTQTTKTHLEALDQDQRYREISRLVGGSTISSLSDAHAKQIIEWADHYKESRA